MTKGKKWTLRLLGVAALALLICLCLLGSTMARYTSSGVGQGTLTVAIWDLEVTGAESGDLELSTDPISPSEKGYDEVEGARTNQSGWVSAFAIQNNSAVAAKVDVTLKTENTDANATVDLEWDDCFVWGTGWDTSKIESKYASDDTNKAAYTSRTQTNAYAQDLMAKFGFTTTETEAAAIDAYYKAQFIALVNAWEVISLELSDSNETTPGEGSKSLSNIALDAKGGTKDSADIYAEVVWTSVYGGNNEFNAGNAKLTTTTFTSWEEFSDAMDTILGMYVTTIEFDVEWTAVQNSTLPPAALPDP